MISEVLTAVNIKLKDFQEMPLCGLAEGYQYFGEIYRSRIHFLYPDVG
jgi:hypothetical protein